MKEKIYQHLIDQGLCIWCRQPNDRTTQLCSACSLRQARRSSELRNQRASKGLCIQCGTKTDGTRCSSCLKKQHVHALKMQERFITKKLCFRCCKQEAVPNRRMCQICLQHSSRRTTRNCLAKRETDPLARIHHNIAVGIRSFLKGKARASKRNVDLVGCSWQELRDHLESTFPVGCSWENRQDWQIDHIIPKDFFEDYGDPLQQRMCWHWTNLQVLWAEDNRNKSNKILAKRIWLGPERGWIDDV